MEISLEDASSTENGRQVRVGESLGACETAKREGCKEEGEDTYGF